MSCRLRLAAALLPFTDDAGGETEASREVSLQETGLGADGTDIHLSRRMPGAPRGQLAEQDIGGLLKLVRKDLCKLTHLGASREVYQISTASKMPAILIWETSGGSGGSSSSLEIRPMSDQPKPCRPSDWTAIVWVFSCRERRLYARRTKR